MCGIYISIVYDSVLEKNIWKNIEHRGPDNSTSLQEKGHFFGFHRLSLQDISSKGNQPFFKNNILLLCNGEVYNFQELKKEFHILTDSQSDCEVILYLYQKIGLEETLKKLSGYFSFFLYDFSKNIYFVARDPFGVRSLFFGKKKSNREFIFTSELKSLYPSCLPETIQVFPPGYYFNGKDYYQYYDYWIRPNISSDLNLKMQEFYDLFYHAVKKRLGMEREFGVFLSGGLDSSLIAGMVQKIWKKPIRTFSIGMKGSPDLYYAKKVAKYIGSEHFEYEITSEKMLSYIEKVIYQIESYDITTIRASIPMYILSEYIKENTNIKVIFSGEGSDEMSGGYLYFHKYPSPEEFHHECCRLMKDLCYFDCLRTDKTTAGNGLEVRCPFLDKELVEFYLSIPIKFRLPENRIEKWFIRKVFDQKNILPSEILWRKKEAFSDGVSQKTNSWYTILQKYTKDEKNFYKEIFQKYYKGCEHTVPYYWMPKWNKGVTDPSARCL